MEKPGRDRSIRLPFTTTFNPVKVPGWLIAMAERIVADGKQPPADH